MRQSFWLMTLVALGSATAQAQDSEPTLQVTPLQRPSGNAAPVKPTPATPVTVTPMPGQATSAGQAAPVAIPSPPAAADSARPALASDAKPADEVKPQARPRPVSKPAASPRPTSSDGALRVSLGQTVSGRLSNNASRDYRLSVKAGTKVRIELAGKVPLAYFTISRPDGKPMHPVDTRGWLGELPDEGEYGIRVYLFREGAGSEGRPVDYRLRVLPAPH